MEHRNAPELDPAVERLAGELAEVEASIILVSSGVANRVTLTGLRFGRVVADRLGADAASRGVEVEASFWPEDEVADISVTRSESAAPATAAAPASATSRIERE
jgi:hypothetical protein